MTAASWNHRNHVDSLPSKVTVKAKFPLLYWKKHISGRMKQCCYLHALSSLSRKMLCLSHQLIRPSNDWNCIQAPPPQGRLRVELQSEHPNGKEMGIKVTLNVVSAAVASQEWATADLSKTTTEFHSIPYSSGDDFEKARNIYQAAAAWKKNVSASGARRGKSGWRLQEGDRKSNKPGVKLRCADKHLWIHNTSDCKAEEKYKYTCTRYWPSCTNRSWGVDEACYTFQCEHTPTERMRQNPGFWRI